MHWSKTTQEKRTQRISRPKNEYYLRLAFCFWHLKVFGMNNLCQTMLNHIMDVFPMIYNQEGASCSQILGGPDTGTVDLLGHFDTFLFCSSKQLPCLRLMPCMAFYADTRRPSRASRLPCGFLLELQRIKNAVRCGGGPLPLAPFPFPSAPNPVHNTVAVIWRE